MVTQCSIDQMFEKVASLEQKVQEQLNQLGDLKRSLFIKLAKDMAEENVDQYDELRFHLFKLYLKVVQNRTHFYTSDVMHWFIALDILQVKHRMEDVKACLRLWSVKGKLGCSRTGWFIANSTAEAGPPDASTYYM